MALKANSGILKVQPNYRVHLLENYRLNDPGLRAQLQMVALLNPQGIGDDEEYTDNPDIPMKGSGGSGADKEYKNQWSMKSLGVKDAWKNAPDTSDMVVAVIDTGIDYTHEDLVDVLWRNPGEMGKDANGKEKATNGVDDDGNGYVDDIIGWDFASKDNKPYDLKVSLFEMLFSGGNPGHGTHVSGNVGAKANNGKGVVGVAHNIKIMGLRFITEKGSGTTADAISAIEYAINNGAKVLSNSWGSEGEDPNDKAGNEALRDAVQFVQDHGGLFIAAAGNGHQGVGYDNDNDKAPGYPASYEHDTIISVAAIDEEDALGSFSNWGKESVDLGAPGVKVFSTTVGNNYTDVVVDLRPFMDMVVYWDGTSMATPHVSGAAALYWSKHPTKSWSEVKEAILSSVKKTNTLNNKVVSDGQLDVSALLKM